MVFIDQIFWQQPKEEITPCRHNKYYTNYWTTLVA